MTTQTRVEKSEVIRLLEECSAKGEPLAGARTLRTHFGCGSFSTYNSILEAWKTSKNKIRENELKAWAFHRKDLEGRIVTGLLQTLNARCEEILNELLKQANVDLETEKTSKKEALAKLEEVQRENARLEEQLNKQSLQLEEANRLLANKIEETAQKCALEKELIKANYEEKMREQQKINDKLDALLRELTLRPRGRPRPEIKEEKMK